MSITLIVVDDHAILRQGVKLILEGMPDLQVKAEASGGAEALERLSGSPVDVAIVDLSMPGMNGIDLTEQIRTRWPGTQVVVLSMHGSAEFVHRSLRAGALGYVLKESAAGELIDAVRAAAAKVRYLSPALRETLIDHMLDQNAPSPLERLSARERQVLQFIVEGHTSRAIGERLSLSPKSVETYRRRLMEKLGIFDVPQLVRFAIQHGLTHTPYAP
jgi:DNA-binding NarL/FixJ family response regulator